MIREDELTEDGENWSEHHCKRESKVSGLNIAQSAQREVAHVRDGRQKTPSPLLAGYWIKILVGEALVARTLPAGLLLDLADTVDSAKAETISARLA